MTITFDGPNTLITLASGVTEVDVIDIYSEWKLWVQESDNAKYLAAFRTVGGDPLSSIINAGSYFFLRNDFGWRVKAPEEDITIYLTGNLAVQDTTLPAFVPTVGGYTAAVLGLQPVTQGVTPIMAEQLAFSSFAGGVWVDQVKGSSGTGVTADGHPIGSAEVPVNNFVDARTISVQRGLPETMFIKGNALLTTGDDVSGFKLIGQNAIRTAITINAAAITNGCTVEDAFVTGNLDGGTLLERCVVQNLNYINGFVHACMLNPGTISLGGTDTAHFLDCYSGIPGQGTPIIDMNGSGGENTPLAMRGYNGGIELIHKTGDADVSIDLASGQVKIDPTCVDGTIVVRGDGKVFDTAGNHMDSGTYNGNLTVHNEANFGEHIHDLWKRMGLDKENPVAITQTRILVDDIDIAIGGDGENSSSLSRQ